MENKEDPFQLDFAVSTKAGSFSTFVENWLTEVTYTFSMLASMEKICFFYAKI